MIIAQRFIAGITDASHEGKSRQGRLNRFCKDAGSNERYRVVSHYSVVPNGTHAIIASRQPGNKLPGYFRSSLRNAKHAQAYICWPFA